MHTHVCRRRRSVAERDAPLALPLQRCEPLLSEQWSSVETNAHTQVITLPSSKRSCHAALVCSGSLPLKGRGTVGFNGANTTRVVCHSTPRGLRSCQGADAERSFGSLKQVRHVWHLSTIGFSPGTSSTHAHHPPSCQKWLPPRPPLPAASLCGKLCGSPGDGDTVTRVPESPPFLRRLPGFGLQPL